MFGYRNMKWNKPDRNTWVSHDGQYRIDRLDAITYCPSKQMDDHVVRSLKAFSKLAQAKSGAIKSVRKIISTLYKAMSTKQTDTVLKRKDKDPKPSGLGFFYVFWRVDKDASAILRTPLCKMRSLQEIEHTYNMVCYSGSCKASRNKICQP